jgi:hypothetical protein
VHLCVCYREAANDVVTRINSRVLRYVATIGQTHDLRGEVGVAEERDGLTVRRNCLRVADLLRGRRDDAVQRGPQHVVAPAREEIAHIDDNGSWLKV